VTDGQTDRHPMTANIAPVLGKNKVHKRPQNTFKALTPLIWICCEFVAQRIDTNDYTPILPSE